MAISMLPNVAVGLAHMPRLMGSPQRVFSNAILRRFAQPCWLAAFRIGAQAIGKRDVATHPICLERQNSHVNSKDKFTFANAINFTPTQNEYTRNRRSWTKEEDDKLLELVKRHGRRWTTISKQFVARSPATVCNRYLILIASDKEFRGPWTKEEFNKLCELTKGIKHVDHADWEGIRAALPRCRPLAEIRQTWKHSINPKIKHGRWTAEENEQFKKLIKLYGLNNWDAVSEAMGTRTRRQCLERWRWQVASMKKGRFTPEEDAAIIEAVAKYGPNFALIKKALGSTRTPRHLSQHYQYALNPETDRSPWTAEEEKQVYDMCLKFNHDMKKAKEALGSSRHVKDMWNHFYKVERAKKKELVQNKTESE